jgi:hypothetical protein
VCGLIIDRIFALDSRQGMLFETGLNAIDEMLDGRVLADLYRVTLNLAAD